MSAFLDRIFSRTLAGATRAFTAVAPGSGSLHDDVLREAELTSLEVPGIKLNSNAWRYVLTGHSQFENARVRAALDSKGIGYLQLDDVPGDQKDSPHRDVLFIFDDNQTLRALLLQGAEAITQIKAHKAPAATLEAA